MRLEKGQFRARLADTPADLDRAQELRHLGFLAARGMCRPGGRDVDDYDATSQHVLIENQSDGRLLGCFRLAVMSPDQMDHSYSGQFYDLSRLADFPGKAMELGRFCLHPGVHDPDALRLSWAMIAKLVDAHGISLLFGCTSFAGGDAGLHQDALAHLSAHHLAPAAFAPGPRIGAVALPHGAADPRRALAQMPALLRSYLGMGGWVSDHAVIDSALDTLHVFTGLEVARIPPARARALRALAG